MNVGLDLFIAVVMTFVTYLMAKQSKAAGKTIKFIGAFAIIFPLVIILARLIYETYGVTSQAAINAAGNKAITSTADWFGKNLPGAAISDVGGIIAGALISFFTGRPNNPS